MLLGMRQRSPCVAVLLALGFVPATALANPGPNPEAAPIFLAVFVLQMVAAVALVAARGTSTAGSIAALVLAFLGIASPGITEASLLFQVPAAVLILLFSASAGRRLRVLGLVATLTAAIGIPWGMVTAREPQGFYGLRANALAGDTWTRDAGSPQPDSRERVRQRREPRER